MGSTDKTSKDDSKRWGDYLVMYFDCERYECMWVSSCVYLALCVCVCAYKVARGRRFSVSAPAG